MLHRYCLEVCAILKFDYTFANYFKILRHFVPPPLIKEAEKPPLQQGVVGVVGDFYLIF